MHDLIVVVIQMATGVALPALVVKWDERRLSPLEQSRCWPPASFWSAVVIFGLFCLPVHFARSRRSILGAAHGLLWTLGVALVIGCLAWMLGPTGD